MTNQPQPDPAAVRCADKIIKERLTGWSTAEAINQICALPQGRALAEAVLEPDYPHNYRVKLAHAYLDTLKGKAASQKPLDNPKIR